MQTNLPYGVDDLPLITRLYRKMYEIAKGYRIIYETRNGNKEYVGVSDLQEVEERVKDIQRSGHKIINMKLLKSKVYVKKPSDAPSNVKIQEGKRGGHFYETSPKQPKQELPKQETIEQMQKIVSTLSYKHLRQTKYLYKEEKDYDIFQFGRDRIIVYRNDLPDGIVDNISRCIGFSRFVKLKEPPIITFRGKTSKYAFIWTEPNGSIHHALASGTADYILEVINIYDSYRSYDVIDHETGHFIYKEKLIYNFPRIEPELIGFESIKDIKDYSNMVQILRNHNIPIDKDHLNDIMNHIEEAKQLNILEDMHNVGLQYYDNGYGSLLAIYNRIERNRRIDLVDYEIKLFNKYRKEKTEALKKSEIFNDWSKIYSSEGFKGNTYAERDSNECFADFYAKLCREVLLIKDEVLRKEMMKRIELEHPLKYNFFKKYILEGVLL